MNNIVGLGVFAVGIVLLILGFSDSQTISSEVSRTFGGISLHRTTLMVGGGGIAVLLGLALAIRSRKS